jgi:hypothetical protein
VRVVLAALLLFVAAPTMADDLGNWSAWVDTVLRTSPAEEVKQAVRKGDTRYIMVADCAEMIPGYPRPTPENLNVAEPKNLRKIGPSCRQILGKEPDVKLKALSE